MKKYFKLALAGLVGVAIQLTVGYIGVLLITLVVMTCLMIKLKQYKKVLGA